MLAHGIIQLLCNAMHPVGERQPDKGLPFQDEFGRELSTPPQDRVAAVRPFWETQADDERTGLLQASLPLLRERAAEIAVRQRKQAGACLPSPALALLRIHRLKQRAIMSLPEPIHCPHMPHHASSA